jgi:proline iminopeptidase
MTERRTLYPEIEPYASGMLDAGMPYALLGAVVRRRQAGGVLPRRPRRGDQLNHRSQFDPAKYDVLLFDQGARKSTPHANLDANTTWHLVEEIERLRELPASTRMVFGGAGLDARRLRPT